MFRCTEEAIRDVIRVTDHVTWVDARQDMDDAIGKLITSRQEGGGSIVPSSWAALTGYPHVMYAESACTFVRLGLDTPFIVFHLNFWTLPNEEGSPVVQVYPQVMYAESTCTFVRIGLETPFIVFHLSVLLSVFRQIRRGHPTFRSAFFYIYLIQSVFEVTNYYTTVLIYRLPRIGAIPKVVLDFPMGTLLNLIANYCLYFQFIAHSAIALNRYALIALRSGFWTSMWKGRKLKVVILLMFLLPLPGTIPRLLCITEAVETTTPGIYTIVCDASWVYGVGNIASVIYSTVTSAVSLTLELGTLLAYRKLSDQGRRKYREDYRLLLFALLQFAGQLLMTVRSFAVIVNVFFLDSNKDVTSVIQGSYSYIIGLVCLGSPICLFSTSRLVRRYHLLTGALPVKCTKVATTTGVNLTTKN